MNSVPNELIDSLHSRFGPPSTDRKIEIEFGPEPPQIIIHDAKIRVRLGFSCKSDPVRCTFQLAHELVHTLEPVPFGHATILEEGAATYFQYWYMRERMHLDPTRFSNWFWPGDESPKYKVAHEILLPHISVNEYALREFRVAGNSLSEFELESLVAALPTLDHNTASLLKSPFEAWSGAPPNN